MRLRDIYTRYNEELKPLIAEQEMRMSAFQEPLLLNLSKMFDFLAKYEENDGDVHLLKEMDDILSVCIAQSYMYVATSIKEDVKLFEKTYGRVVLDKLSAGGFASDYESLKDEIKRIDKKCKKDRYNYSMHLTDYQQSYQKCLELERLIEKVNNTDTLLLATKKKRIVTIVRWGLSIIISLLVTRYLDVLICNNL